jgi:hypothetical protein
MTPRRFVRVALAACFLTLIVGELAGQQSLNYHPTFKRMRSATATVSSVGMVPTIYAQWWKAAQDCAGVTSGSLDAWQLYTVSAEGFTIDDGEDVFNGATFPDTRRIYVRLDMWLDPSLLTHEMLHAVLYDAGRPYMHHTKDATEFSAADEVFIRCGLRVPPLREPA